MRAVRCVVRALGALLAVSATVPGLVVALSTAPASASASADSAATATAAVRQQPLAVSITGMSPSVASKGKTIRLSGTLANHTGSAVTGISAQLYTSPTVLPTRSEMNIFVSGGNSPDGLDPAGTPWVSGTVRDGETVHWAANFPADSFYSQFGVFPVRVLATTPGGQYSVTASTALPYWPSSSASQPKKLQTAWIWPLADAPQQGACSQTLASGQISRSVAGGGRLSTLLDAGAAWATEDNLTWDIDPALVSDVSVMTSTYYTRGNDVCSGRFKQQPSAAAKSWLAKLKTTTAGAPAFATPYANVDAAALSHAGLNSNLRSAYQLGQGVAGQLLPETFGSAGTGGEDTQVLKAAWPAGGVADGGVLANLAKDGGVSTVVLASGELPSATSRYDDALSKTTTAIGTPMSVLLADSGLTSLLGTANAKAATPSGQFALTQDFLAQTAMISSEAPALSRSLVIAPPPSWDPSPGEAKGLLSAAAHDAPWLSSASLSDLAAQAAKLPSKSPKANHVSPAELPASYVAGLRTASASLSLFTGLLYQPPATLTSTLDAALAGAESSAWRGKGLTRGWLASTYLQDYLKAAESKVSIISGKKILLAGSSGDAPVSVSNELDALNLNVTVAVKVTASTRPGSQLDLGSQPGSQLDWFSTLLKVDAGKTRTAKLRVHSATIGTSTVRLQLVTRDGSPLGVARPLSIEVTRVGRFLLAIIGCALGLLVLTSVYRLRRKRLARARQGGSGDGKADTGGAG